MEPRNLQWMAPVHLDYLFAGVMSVGGSGISSVYTNASDEVA